MYVVDTGVFVVAGSLYPSNFGSFWQKFDELVKTSVIVSVREVRKEIEEYCAERHIDKWVKAHRDVFARPSIEEMAFIAEMFKKEQCRGLVRAKKIRKGSPVADPFVIAAGKVFARCVVTKETGRTKGSAGIPAVCDSYGVRCIGVDEFFTEIGIKL